MSSRVELPLRSAPMLVVVSRENITTAAAAAAHKFVTAVLQMVSSSIFPARFALAHPRPRGWVGRSGPERPAHVDSGAKGRN